MIRVLSIQAYDRNSPESFLSVPLGIHRMGFWCEDRVEGVKFDFLDPNLYFPNGAEKAQEVLAKGMDGKGPYDVITFSPLHFTLEHDLGIMYSAGKISPQSLFVAGGQQAAFANEQLYGNWDQLDAVFVGEGEKPMEELLHMVKQHGVDYLKKNPKEMQDIPGARLRGSYGGPPNPAMSHEDYVTATRNLDFGPRMRSHDYWQWIEKRYSEEELKSMDLLRKIRVVKPYTTNFCPKNCSFCSTTKFYRDAGDGQAKVRGLRGRELSDYLRLILDTNQDALTIYFKDDLWFIRGKARGEQDTTDYGRLVRQFAQEHLDKKVPLKLNGDRGLLEDLMELHAVRTDPAYAERGVSYFGKARVDTFVDKQLNVDWTLLAASKLAGFDSISFGVESFDREELDHFNKCMGENGPAMNRLALEACKQAGIHVVAYMILSSDISTPDKIMTSVDEASLLTHEGHTIKINPWLYSLPGTDLEELHRTSSPEVQRERYEIPGHPGKAIERVTRIFPRDQSARELMERFEERLPSFKQNMMEQLGRTHFISELNTPTQFILLYQIAKEMGIEARNTNSGKRIDFDERVKMLAADLEKHKNDEGTILTFA